MENIDVKKIIFSVIFVVACLAIAIFGLIPNSLSQLAISGVDQNMLYLLLIIPFLALIVSVSRIIIGINVPTLLIPTILVCSLFAIGFDLTVIFLFISIALALLGKYLITEFHLHFSTKLSIIFSFVSIGLILILPLLKTPFLITTAAIYPILVISFVNEKQFSFKLTKSSLISDFKSIFKTIIFSVICFILLGGTVFNYQFSLFKDLITAFPDSILAAFLLNFLIGHYTGLRITEVIRFRKLIFKSK